MALRNVAFQKCINPECGAEFDCGQSIFKCPKCGCEVSVVMSRELFAQLAKTFGRNE